MKNSHTNIDKLKLIFLVLYFIILTIERVHSLINVFRKGFYNYDIFDYYMVILVIFSLAFTYIYIGFKFLKNKSDDNLFNELSVASGVLLLSGMVHTYSTISIIQFIAYGMLLISMFINTKQYINNESNSFKKCFSYIYILAFSMSIPVVYRSKLNIDNIFTIIEIIVSSILVYSFTIILKNHYLGNTIYNFDVFTFVFALLGDILIIVLRWNEKINWFLLISISITTILWIIGRLLIKLNLNKVKD